jgi:hypothetical protein
MSASRHRVADRLLLVTNLVVANVAAACFVVMFVHPSVLFGGGAEALAQLSGGARLGIVPLGEPLAWLCFLAGAVLLLWNFTWLVRRREQAPPSNWVVSDTPSGPVRIAREAIENGLQKAGEALPEITRVRIQVDTRTQKRILVTGQFQCAEGTNNLAASQRLRSAMVDRLNEMVRPSDGARFEFDLEFQGFAGKLGKKGTDVPPPEPPPFTGPKYPIDDDSHGGT